ncbi:DNA mismatch repair protein MSH1, mitochondrial isoform X1 [Rhododendron vialii]|uniref:DNA mismatch repair protein MSH1, mitochondrial isoform X1 n=1 Tax=Rhododendron vialii TaxID=182163 RepID=UPI00265F66E2|nr:DNA mismatch repair protein MSH1, mitochondrial isoform X1 [Rhododendron vialii]
MYWLTAKSVLVSIPRWRALSLLLRPPIPRRSFTSSRPLHRRQGERLLCLKEQKNFKGFAKSIRRPKESNNVLDEKNYSHILWWKERMESCRKPSTVQLIKRLMYSNLLGLDINLKNGSLKEGTLNREILQFKSTFPREVLLCRVGDFYEALGIDACILVEHAGLNPFGGLRTDSIPRAGCPVVNLRQTLDDLTRNGYSVCIVEEVQGPTQARSRKDRFISGHAHPGSPYVFGLVGADHDLDFPEPMPVIGISRSAKGYCIISVLETMKTYSTDDGLTEEALVTKLRTGSYHHLFLHTSLRHNSSGTCRWGEFGEGGLLWGECRARHYEWLDGNPMNELLSKVKELYGLDDEVTFRNITVTSENRPRPIHLGTATQIGAIPTEGIPSLLKVLLPPNCTGLPVLYIRDLLLNPPAYAIASTIQEVCRLMGNVRCSIPEFTCVSSAKLVKLLELREANHIEFCKIKSVLDEILQMYKNPELLEILKLLMDPTWVATGLKIDFDKLVSECEWTSTRIGEIISLDVESDQPITSYPNIPSEFFEDMESSWKGRVKRIHLEEAFEEVEKAAAALSLAVSQDFLPIISRIKASTAPLGGPKGEILYAREHEAVWFKGKRFTPAVWAGTPGEVQIKQLKAAVDSKGRKVGEEWFTTVKVEDALTRYHEAGAEATARVLELLRTLSAELQSKINILVFASILLVIAKALFAHVSEGRRRKWVFPTLTPLHPSKDVEPSDVAGGMKIIGLSPYWFDVAQGSAVQNTVDMQSLVLLTGPNGGGKSSLLRSICAASLLGICGLMVPAESAFIPHFDSIMLHMKSYDSPADGKSSFQMEMSEIRSVISGATSRSLVLVDEICRGTETAKGTCIAGSIVETLDAIGCLGIVSTHLHGIFDLPLTTNHTVYKAMATENVDGLPKPTWKLIDGICKESLAFETAQREGIPETIIQRAEELYSSVYTKGMLSERSEAKLERFTLKTNVNGSNESSHRFNGNCKSEFYAEGKSATPMEILQKEVESAVTIVVQKKLIELYNKKNLSEFPEVKCVAIAAREQPPPSTIGSSSVYVMLRPDRKLYVGETDDLEGRIRAHRSKKGMDNASFIYFLVPGKSLACQLETLLVNQLPNQGFQLTNQADGKHRNFGTSSISLESVSAHR